ncbi:hypothetical protein ACFXGA_06200 [Actinosynnema sp. NPDC059335]|uniref:hypothetical protein n=1 Tax=Actinosynnema sp. NPDC059335 TaxID=3346804 RepID=UPI003670BA5C
MGKSQSMVNVRMAPPLIAEIDDAAARSTATSRSSWSKEVLLAAARSGLTLDDITALLTNPPSGDRPRRPRRARAADTSQTLGATRYLTGECLHPIHLRRHYPTRDVCAGCNRPVPRR